MRVSLSKIIWILLVAAFVGFIGYGFLPEPIAVEMVRPERGMLEITVDDDGETRIREKYIVSAPVSGKMLRIQLQSGDAVVFSETELAQIKPSDPSLLDVRTRRETEARVRTAEAAISQGQAAVERAEEALQLATQHNERAKMLRIKNAISDAAYDAAQSRQRMAVAELNSAKFAVRVATYEMDQAEAALRYSKADDDDVDATTFRLKSPIDGVVLNVLNEDSQVVSAGMALMELGDPKVMEIKMDVLSTAAVQIRPGAKVYIEHWGGDNALLGTVRLVEPSAFLKVSALGVEEKRVNVIIDFNDPWEDRSSLGDGFRVEGRIVVGASEPDSLKVPAGAFFQEDDQWYVFRVQDNVATQTAVQVGLSNGLETQVIEGLSEGDQVISHPPDSIADGVKVTEI